MGSFPSGLRFNKRYEILVSDNFELDNIQTSYDPNDIPKLNTEQKHEVELTVAEYESRGVVIEKDAQGIRPPLYRLKRYLVSDQSLILQFGRTDYGEYLATNVKHPEWRYLYGNDAMSDPLAFSVAMVTGDNLLVWGRRSGKLAEAAGACHVLPSGHPHPPESLSIGLYRELEAEAGVQEHELSAQVCTGLVLSLDNTKPELLFYLNTNVKLSDLISRKRSEGWEFSEVYGLPFTPSSVSRWLVDYRDRCVPPGHAAVLLAGRACFGEAWLLKFLSDMG